jgi:hypothetical protein
VDSLLRPGRLKMDFGFDSAETSDTIEDGDYSVIDILIVAAIHIHMFKRNEIVSLESASSSGNLTELFRWPRYDGKEGNVHWISLPVVFLWTDLESG